MDKEEAKHWTPMLQQYWEVKAKYNDTICFTKVGKFYELFYYDAWIGAQVCCYICSSPSAKKLLLRPVLAIDNLWNEEGNGT